MCRHIWKTINNVRVCLRCGVTVNMIDGSVIFDRKLQNAGTGRKKGKEKT